jgi:hypothetical protein
MKGGSVAKRGVTDRKTRSGHQETVVGRAGLGWRGEQEPGFSPPQVCVLDLGSPVKWSHEDEEQMPVVRHGSMTLSEVCKKPTTSI